MFNSILLISFVISHFLYFFSWLWYNLTMKSFYCHQFPALWGSLADCLLCYVTITDWRQALVSHTCCGRFATVSIIVLNNKFLLIYYVSLENSASHLLFVLYSFWAVIYWEHYFSFPPRRGRTEFIVSMLRFHAFQYPIYSIFWCSSIQFNTIHTQSHLINVMNEFFWG